MRSLLLPRRCRGLGPALLSDGALLLELAVCATLFGPQPWAWAYLLVGLTIVALASFAVWFLARGYAPLLPSPWE